MEEEALLEEGHNNSDDCEDAYDSDNNHFCMEKYRICEDTEIIEGNKLAEQEVEDQYSDEDSDEDSDEEQVHYEGDTEVEDWIEMEEEEEQEKEDEVNVVATEEEAMQKTCKKEEEAGS